jgi:succinoglycan biosynthesis protein ExoV
MLTPLSKFDAVGSGGAEQWRFDGGIVRRRSIGLKPTDRGRCGSKPNVMNGPKGTPLAFIVSEENKNDIIFSHSFCYQHLQVIRRKPGRPLRFPKVVQRDTGRILRSCYAMVVFKPVRHHSVRCLIPHTDSSTVTFRMKLHYFHCVDGNVGDDLNPWLWPRILGNHLDDDQQHLFIGIGSILNNRLPEANRYTVLGTGVAGTPPNISQNRWDILALRGPLSKKRLGIQKQLPLLDGAYLITQLKNLDNSRRTEVGFIPHFRSIGCGLWEDVCETTEIRLIDPRLPVEQFLSELSCCDRVLSEAMHGAILADAYDIPWLPVKAYSHINEFKWQDWALSLELEFKFVGIPSTWRGEAALPRRKRWKNSLKRSCARLGFSSRSWTPAEPVRQRSDVESIRLAAQSLVNLAENGTFSLSDARLRSARVEELMDVTTNFVINA